MLSHIAPRGVLLVGSQEPGEVCTSHPCQGVHEPAYADDAASDGAEVLVSDGFHDLLLHLLSDVRVVNHAEVVGQHVGRHGVVAIEGAVRIEYMVRHGSRTFFHRQELAVEGFLRQCSLMVKPGGVSCKLLHLCPTRHHAADVEVIGRGDKRHIGLASRVFAMYQLLAFWWHAPVGILATMDESVFLVLVFQMLHPSFHVGIVAAQGLVVAIVPYQHGQ